MMVIEVVVGKLLVFLRLFLLILLFPAPLSLFPPTPVIFTHVILLKQLTLILDSKKKKNVNTNTRTQVKTKTHHIS